MRGEKLRTSPPPFVTGFGRVFLFMLIFLIFGGCLQNADCEMIGGLGEDGSSIG